MNAFFLENKFWPQDKNFIDEELILGKKTSSIQEFQHLTKVLRLKVGENVLVFNGEGLEAHCQLAEINKNDARLKIINLKQHHEHNCQVTLALGWGKAARRGFILEKCVELEAHGLWFWQAERSQFPLPQDIKNNWQEQLIAGLKQCHNPFLPKLEIMPRGAKEIIEASKHFEHKQLLLEKDYTHDKFLSEEHLGQKGSILCVIGPEGGFTQSEVDLFLANGFNSFSLGERILRWETAALMTLGLHWWKKQNDYE